MVSGVKVLTGSELVAVISVFQLFFISRIVLDVILIKVVFSSTAKADIRLISLRSSRPRSTVIFSRLLSLKTLTLVRVYEIPSGSLSKVICVTSKVLALTVSLKYIVKTLAVRSMSKFSRTGAVVSTM